MSQTPNRSKACHHGQIKHDHVDNVSLVLVEVNTFWTKIQRIPGVWMFKETPPYRDSAGMDPVKPGGQGRKERRDDLANLESG